MFWHKNFMPCRKFEATIVRSKVSCIHADFFFFYKKESSFFPSMMCFSIDLQRRCLTLHLRRFLSRLGRRRGRKPDRLVAWGGRNFIRFSPIDSILNLEDSRGRNPPLLVALLPLASPCLRLLPFLDGCRILSTLLGDFREDDARVESLPREHYDAQCF